MPEIDWVNERAKCSLGQMFERLKTEIAADIEGMNKLIPKHYGFEYKMVNSGRPDRFAVLKDHSAEPFLNRSILFVVEKSAVKVIDTADNNAEKLSATITFNDLGECKFKVGGKERESWQLRKEALEDLFFQG